VAACRTSSASTRESGRPPPLVNLYGVLRVGAAIGLRIGWTLLDPEAARQRASRRDTTTHGVFRGRPFLPWMLLAPTLVILVLFLYWPALHTLQLSTRLARLGAPQEIDRCVANFTELIGPTSPVLHLKAHDLLAAISSRTSSKGAGLRASTRTMWNPCRVLAGRDIWPISSSMPAFVALISGRTISPGGIFRSRIPINAPSPTRTPEKIAVIQSPIGTKYRNKPISAIATPAASTIPRPTNSSIRGSLQAPATG
jgi:hypothetical protein